MYEVFANAGILLGGYTFSESSEISVARLLRFRDCVATLPPCKYVCDFFPCKLDKPKKTPLHCCDRSAFDFE